MKVKNDTWVNIKMPSDLHAKLKAAAAVKRVSLREFIIERLCVAIRERFGVK